MQPAAASFGIPPSSSSSNRGAFGGVAAAAGAGMPSANATGSSFFIQDSGEHQTTCINVKEYAY